MKHFDCIFRYYPRQGGGRGGEGAPRRGRMGRRGPPPSQGGAQGDEGQEGGGAPPQRRSVPIKKNKIHMCHNKLIYDLNMINMSYSTELRGP